MLEILSERITITGYFTRNIRSTVNDLDKLDFNYLYVVFEFQGGIGMFVVAVSFFFSSNKNLPVIYPFYSEQTHLDCVRWCNAQTLPTYNRNDDIGLLGTMNKAKQAQKSG